MPTSFHHAVLFLLCCGEIVLTYPSPSRAAVDFEKEIKPIIESACLHCHHEANAKGGLRLDSLEFATAHGDHEAAIIPVDAAKSSFYTRTVLPAGHEQIMPPEGPRLDESQTSRLKKWIEEGAHW